MGFSKKYSYNPRGGLKYFQGFPTKSLGVGCVIAEEFLPNPWGGLRDSKKRSPKSLGVGSRILKEFLLNPCGVGVKGFSENFFQGVCQKDPRDV